MSPPAPVAEVFARMPPEARERALALRSLVFEVAESRSEVGRLTETLKWGEPAYLTAETRSGTTVRIGWKPATPEHVQLYFHCRTTLVETFRSWFGDALSYEGNRAVRVPIDGPLPRACLEACLEEALTYHLRA